MIELDCPRCGENRFRYPDGARGGDPVLCETCGHDIGTFDEVGQRVADEVERRGEKGPSRRRID